MAGGIGTALCPAISLLPFHCTMAASLNDRQVKKLRTSRAYRAGMCFVGWAWIIAGILIILTAGFRAITGWGSRNWPHVAGHIVQSEVLPVKQSSGATAFYKVKIVYAYSPPSQSGSFFRNDRMTFRGFIDPADDSYTLAQAQQLTRRYLVYRPVNVYYRIGDPRWSVLHPGTDAGTFGGVLMGCIPIVLGTLIVRRDLTRRRLSREMSLSVARR